jgi:hypothetical protein
MIIYKLSTLVILLLVTLTANILGKSINDTIFKTKIEITTEFKNNCKCANFSFSTVDKFLYLDKLNILKLSNALLGKVEVNILDGNFVRILDENTYFLIRPRKKVITILFRNKTNKKVLCSKELHSKLAPDPELSMIYGNQIVDQAVGIKLSLNKYFYLDFGDSLIKKQLAPCEYNIQGKLTIYHVRDTTLIMTKEYNIKQKFHLNELYRNFVIGDRIVIDIRFNSDKDCWGNRRRYHQIFKSISLL